MFAGSVVVFALVLALLLYAVLRPPSVAATSRSSA
jgi:hypothetical protein